MDGYGNQMAAEMNPNATNALITRLTAKAQQNPLYGQYKQVQDMDKSLKAENFRLREANMGGSSNIVTTDMRDQSEQTVYHLNNSINNLRTSIAGAD
jgi:hypothetical protein